MADHLGTRPLELRRLFDLVQIGAADAIAVQARDERHPVKAPTDIRAGAVPLREVLCEPSKQLAPVRIAGVQRAGHLRRGPGSGWPEQLMQRRSAVSRDLVDLEPALNLVFAPRANRAGRRDDRARSEDVHTRKRVALPDFEPRRPNVEMHAVPGRPNPATGERPNVHPATQKPVPTRGAAMVIDIDHGVALGDNQHSSGILAQQQARLGLVGHGAMFAPKHPEPPGLSPVLERGHQQKTAPK